MEESGVTYSNALDLNQSVYISKADLVTAALRDQIMNREWDPGDALPPQRELAARFGVSPTPVREALRRLETEGLIHFDAHKGSTIVDVDFGGTPENYRIRAELESLAVELALPHITDADIADMKRIQGNLESARKDLNAVRQLNYEFHFRLFAVSNSKLLLVLLRQLWQGFPSGPQVYRPIVETINDHRALLAALEARDLADAKAASRHHVLAALHTAKAQAKQRSDNE